MRAFNRLSSPLLPLSLLSLPTSSNRDCAFLVLSSLSPFSLSPPFPPLPSLSPLPALSFPPSPSQISRLVEDVQRLQSGLTRLREASSVQVQSLEEQLAVKTAAMSQLEEKLAAQGDYEELKRELE